MTKTLLAVAAVALTGLLSAPKAEAGHSSLNITYRSGSASCGCPIYTKRFVRGYDCYRRPVFGYSRLPFSHGRSCRHAHRQRSHCDGPVIHRSSRTYGPRVVIQSRRYPSRHYRGGTSFSFSIGGRSCR